MENIRKIRQEIDKELQATNKVIAQRRESLQRFKEYEELYRSISEAKGVETMNPFLAFLIIQQIIKGAQKDRELIEFFKSQAQRRKIGELAEAIDGRLDLYAQAKAQGVEIDQEFEKRFKENVYEAVTSLDIVKDGSLKEKDNELRHAVEKLSEEIKSDISNRSEEGHHAAHQEA